MKQKVHTCRDREGTDTLERMGMKYKKKVRRYACDCDESGCKSNCP